jgi:hypothetical protein
MSGASTSGLPKTGLAGLKETGAAIYCQDFWFFLSRCPFVLV